MPSKTTPARKSKTPAVKAAPTKPFQGRLKELSLGRRDIRILKLEDCDVLTDLNPRTTVTRERIEELKAQLRAAAGLDPDSNGQREPARGHMLPSGKFGLTTGKTRHIALTELKKEHKKFGVILVTPEPQGYTEQDRDLDHITSNDGAPLLMTEQAVIYARFRDRDLLTVKQISSRTGKTEQHIYDCLDLLKTEPAVQQAVNNGKIAASTVVKITKTVEKALVASTVKTAIANAELAGKKKATNKHVPVSTSPKPGKRKTKAASAPAKPAAASSEQQERVAKAAELQADSVARLGEVLTATVPARCVRDRRDTVEWLIDFLKGERSIAETISFMEGNEPLI